MKIIKLLLAFAILLPSNTFAQPSVNSLNVKPHIVVSISKIERNDERTNNDTASRLIAVTTHNNNGSTFYPNDSTVYNYTGSNGGDLNHQPLKYSTGIDYMYNTGTLKYDTVGKGIQQFDANGNIASQTQQYWDIQSSSFINLYQNIDTYDLDHNVLTNEYQTWYTGTSEWINVNNTIYSYASGDTAKYVVQYWGASSWINNYQYLYYYDSNNNDTSILFQNWDSTVSEWINYTNTIYTYDINNNNTSETDQQWNALYLQWDNILEYNYTYDLHNNLLSETDQVWDSSSNKWINTNQFLYTYNSNNNNTSQTILHWDTTATLWDSTYKYFYRYDSNNNDTSQTEQLWDSTKLIWVNLYNERYSYDVSHNNLSTIRQTWDTVKWLNTVEQVYNYNNFNQLLSYTTSTWNSGGFWKSTIYDIEYLYYYQEYVSGINYATDFEHFNLYPNPAGDFIHVVIGLNQTVGLQLRLVNIVGQTVWSEDAGKVTNYQSNISVADLSDGVYLFEILTDKVSESQKVIVTH